MRYVISLVSVPIRGLFNLTKQIIFDERYKDMDRVSVPIRGLFNLTAIENFFKSGESQRKVSVPIRGLFNLTHKRKAILLELMMITSFRPHQGII